MLCNACIELLIEIAPHRTGCRFSVMVCTVSYISSMIKSETVKSNGRQTTFSPLPRNGYIIRAEVAF